jgi:hypothetical protein
MLGRTTRQRGAAPKHMDDAADDPPIVISFRSSQGSWVRILSD